MRMAVDLALAGTERRGIGIVDQQKLQLVNVHSIDDILECHAIPFITKRVVIAFDENDPAVQLRTNGRKVAKTSTIVIPMTEIAHVQHEAVLSHDAIPLRDVLFILFFRAFAEKAPEVRPRTEVVVTRHKGVV